MTPEEELDKTRLYKRYKGDTPNVLDSDVIEFQKTNLAEAQYDAQDWATLQGQYDKAVGEAAYLSWNNHDYPKMNTPANLQIKVPTPKEAKERGMLSELMHGTSNAVVGLYSGVGYGIDELAVSATKALNLINPFFETPEYEARAISKYMDTLEKRGVAGEVARSIGQFMIGWMPWTRGIGLLSKGLSGLKGTKKIGEALQKSKITSNMMASSMAGGTAFSPLHENLGNDLQNIDNALAGAVSEFLATNPNDPEALNRLRNAIQEGGLSWIADKTLVPLFKAAKGAMGKKSIDQFGVPMHEKLVSLLDVERNRIAQSVRVQSKVGKRGKKYMALDSDGKKVMVDDPNYKLSKERETVLRFTIPKETHTFDKMINALDSNADLEAKFRLADTVEEKSWLAFDIAEQINKNAKARKGKRTGKLLERESLLYMAGGLDVNVIRNLPENVGFNDAQIYAFGRLAKSAHDEMIEAVQVAKTMEANHPAYKETVGNAIRTIANHTDTASFLTEVGSTTSHAFHALKKVKKDLLNKTLNADILNSPNLVNILRTGQFGARDVDRMFSMILQSHEQMDSIAMTNSLMDGFGEGSNWNKFVESWINLGLLSNPATHALNVFTGAANLTTHVGSQLTAATISKIPFANKVFGTDPVLYREAFGSMYGLVQGLTRSFRLALRAGVTNEQLITKGTKIENYSAKHWAAKHFGEGIGGAENTALGLGFDFMGSLNRLPGRFLLMEDEFVKSISYEMNLHSKAWKYAFKNADGIGPRSQAYKDIVENPKHFEDQLGGFHEQGKDFANLMTFQEQTGDIVSNLSSVTNNHPYLKLFVPFLKVLTNIPKMLIRHSPAGVVKGLRTKAFDAGGSARMLEIGRMSYGTMMMMYGAHLYNTGNLTGTGSRKYWERKNREEMGIERELSLKIKPFNAKTDDKYWMDISRFAPYSNMLAMGADVASIVNAHPNDPEMWTDMTMKAVGSVQKHLISGTWAPNLHKLLGVVADDRMEGRDWARAVKSIVGTMQPSFLRSYEKVIDPEAPELKTYKMTGGSNTDAMPTDWSAMVAKLLAVSPSHSDLVPDRRNFLGNPVKRKHFGKDDISGRIAPSLMGLASNPMVSFLSFTKVEENDDLRHLFGSGTEKEINPKTGKKEDRAQLGLDISPPSDIVDVGRGGYSVRMNPYEYDEYTKMIPRVKDHLGRTMMDQVHAVRKTDLYKILPASRDGRENDRRGIMTHIYNKYKRLAQNHVVHKYKLYDRAVKAHEQYEGER